MIQELLPSWSSPPSDSLDSWFSAHDWADCLSCEFGPKLSLINLGVPSSSATPYVRQSVHTDDVTFL